MPAAGTMPASSAVFGKNAAVLQSIRPVLWSIHCGQTYPGVPIRTLYDDSKRQNRRVRHRPVSGRSRRCRSNAAQANPLMRHGFHTQSPVHHSLLSDRPSRAWAPTPDASMMLGMPWGPMSCPFGDIRGQTGSGDCWIECMLWEGVSISLESCLFFRRPFPEHTRNSPEHTATRARAYGGFPEYAFAFPRYQAPHYNSY